MSETNEIGFHPLADIFPLMEGAAFDELVADIKANGQRQWIVTYEGMILDGRNRYRACLAAGVKPGVQKGDDCVGDPAAYVVSANIHRRHLNAEQKRDLIAKLLKAQPQKSDRQIAETVKASPTTVGVVRREIESTVQSGQLPPKRIGADGKARKRPAKKKGREQRAKRFEDGRPKLTADEISQIAYKLIQLDIGLARELNRVLWQGGAERLMSDLNTGIEIESADSNCDGVAAGSASTEAAQPKKRGRPKGSKNKPKPPPAEDAAVSPPRDGENADTAEASAEAMKAQFAEMESAELPPLNNEDGLDIPESLRRAPKAAAP
jgi:hypothetical protein